MAPVKLIFRFHRTRRSANRSSASLWAGVAGNAPSTPERLEGSSRIGLGIPCSGHRRPSTIMRMLDKPRLDEVLIPFVRQVVGGPEAGGGSVETMVGDASTRRVPPGARQRRQSRERRHHGASRRADEIRGSERSSRVGSAGAAVLERAALPSQRAAIRSRASTVPTCSGGWLRSRISADRTFESAVRDAPEAERRRFYRTAIEQIVALQTLGDRGGRRHLRRVRTAVRRAPASLGARPLQGVVSGGRAGERSWRRRRRRRWRQRSTGWPASSPGRRRRWSTATSRVGTSWSWGDAGPALKVIDFQDALMGTRAYDLVALLRDSYVVLSRQPRSTTCRGVHSPGRRRGRRGLPAAVPAPDAATQAQGRRAIRLHRPGSQESFLPALDPRHGRLPARRRQCRAGRASGIARHLQAARPRAKHLVIYILYWWI